MKILSHRGYWKKTEEKNSLVAFERSFKLGFGTETDVRDYHGSLVISHDIPQGGEMSFNDFLELAASYSNLDNPLTIALNIKADGLANIIALALKKYQELDCFVFDMAVPDMRSYFSEDMQVFSRTSEVETPPVWMAKATGIWLDAFDADWFEPNDIVDILDANKRLCIVSPELHGRPHLPIWKKIKSLPRWTQLMLCTDLPEEALIYFERNCYEE